MLQEKQGQAKHLVVAKSLRDFAYYIRTNDLKLRDCVYAVNMKNICGYEFGTVDVIWVDGWYWLDLENGVYDLLCQYERAWKHGKEKEKTGKVTKADGN